MTLRRLLTGDATRTTTSPHRHGDQGRRSHIRGLQSLRSCRPLRGGGAQGSASQTTTAVLLLGSAPVRVAAAPMLASSLLDTGCLPRLGTESEEADHLPTSVFTRSHCLASGRFSDCHRRRAALSSHAPGPRRTRCHGGRHGSSSSDTRGAVDVSAGVCSAGPRLGPGPRPDIRADAAGLLGSGGARGRSRRPRLRDRVRLHCLRFFVRSGAAHGLRRAGSADPASSGLPVEPAPPGPPLSSPHRAAAGE